MHGSLRSRRLPCFEPGQIGVKFVNKQHFPSVFRVEKYTRFATRRKPQARKLTHGAALHGHDTQTTNHYGSNQVFAMPSSRLLLFRQEWILPGDRIAGQRLAMSEDRFHHSVSHAVKNLRDFDRRNTCPTLSDQCRDCKFTRYGRAIVS